MSEPSGLRFAHFEVRTDSDGKPEELGRGAMGVTYRAFDRQLQREVALKVINPAQVGDAKARALFLREARAAARVHHSNVGSVVFLNADHPENLFYAMEFIPGESLRDWLHSRVPLEPRLAIGLALQLARGLEAIHHEGVIHRDLKPGNVMVVRVDKARAESEPEAWRLKIIDFGLARPISGDISESTAAAVTTGYRGTVLYSSPEQCEERRDLDGRTDQYALGCILWEMLVGAPPFRANVHREVLNAHVAKPLPLAQLSHLSGGVQSIVKRMLAKDREHRYVDDGALIADLESCHWRLENGMPDTSGVADETMMEVAEPPKKGREKPAANVAVPAAAPGGRRLAVAGACVLIPLLAWFVLSQNNSARPSAARDAGNEQWLRPIVAVLPFEGVDADEKEQALANALTTQVNNRLAQLPSVRIVPETAMAAAQRAAGPGQRRIKALDAALGGVSAILESSISRQGSEFKINSALYDARTERRLWGRTFTRSTGNSTIAQELPDQILRSVRILLAAAARENPAATAPGAPSASDLYFQAVALDIFDPRRRELLEQVVKQDPKFAEAYVELAGYRINHPPSPAEHPDLSREALLREHQRAINELLDKAIALNPTFVDAQAYKAQEAESDPIKKAELFGRALAAEPNNFRVNVISGFEAEDRGNDAEAYSYIRKAHAIDPEFRRLPYRLYWIAERAGAKAVAARWLGRIFESTTDMQARELIHAKQLFDLGQYENSLNQLNLLPPVLHKEFFSGESIRRKALWQLGRFADLLQLSQEGRDMIHPKLAGYWRAILLWHLGRMEESKSEAARALPEMQMYLETRTSIGEETASQMLRVAQLLEILGRGDEALPLIQKFVQLDQIPYSEIDATIFRDSPATLSLLNSRLQRESERTAAVARRIEEIERAYSGESPAGKTP